MNKISISWTDVTWNPVTGCTPISEACDQCYARRMSKRLAGRAGYPPDDPFRVTCHPDRLDEPLRMKKPRTIFVCSMGDFWHPDVNPCFRALVFNTVSKCTQHRFMFLTKRALEMFEDLTQNVMTRQFLDLPNVWLGVTAENQVRADERLPILWNTPAKHRFVSIEPMLGPVDLREVSTQGVGCAAGCKMSDCMELVICGGETGPGARPMHPAWVRSLRDQCAAAGCAFHFKSWGEFSAPSQMSESDEIDLEEKMRVDLSNDAFWDTPIRVGKKRAGHLLDGREYSGKVEK